MFNDDIYVALLLSWLLHGIVLSPYFETFMEPRNRFQGMNSASLCSLAGRYDNPIPTRFLAPMDCLKIPALPKIVWEERRLSGRRI